MQICKAQAPADAPLERIYIAAATLREFRQKKNVEIQLFRVGAKPEEIEACKGLGLVGKPPADIPPEILAGATEEAALACLMEAFTEQEISELEKYLETRYGTHIERLTIGPLDLPIPLGVGSLSQLPESSSAGFINFDQAPGYPLKFAFRGYYDLSENQAAPAAADAS